MDDEALYQILVELMEKLSIKVVRKNLEDEEFRISGGFCKLRGENLMILDKRVPMKGQVEFLVRELANHNLEEVFVPPVLRELIERVGGPT